MFQIHQTKSSTRERRVQLSPVRGHRSDKLPHPSPHGPLIFADTANIDDIRPLYQAGIVSGVTTNPSLLKKAGADSWAQAEKIMQELLELVAPNPLLLELLDLTEPAMIKQGQQFAALGDNVVIKVPVGGYRAVDPSYDPHTGLKVIHALWQRGIACCATLVFNSTQALWAANAGAYFVAPFIGRLADYAYRNDHPERPAGNSLYWLEDHRNAQQDQNIANTEYVACGGRRKDIGPRLIQEISAIFTNYDIKTQVLAASFRHFAQLSECALAGADILTVPAQLLQLVADHPLTTQGMATFFADYQAFEK